MQSTISLLLSSILGGAVVALINWFRIERISAKERKINFLDEQVRNLYGRLYYYISQNERLFEIYNRYHVAYNEYFNRGWNEQTEKDAKLTLAVANKYIHEIYNNNQKIKNTLDTNSSLIDPVDVEYFLLFYEHYTRLNIEIDDEGKSVLPPPIANKLGMISILNPEVIDGVKQKFLEKKKQLDTLRDKQKRGNIFCKIGGVTMNTWMKYLVIGWSIVTLGIILVSFQIMKKDLINENYIIPLPETLQAKISEAKKHDYTNQKIIDYLQDKFKEWIDRETLSIKAEELNKLLMTKELHIKSQHHVDSIIYLILPIYAFGIWAIPILVFFLVGSIFSRKS